MIQCSHYDPSGQQLVGQWKLGLPPSQAKAEHRLWHQSWQMVLTNSMTTYSTWLSSRSYNSFLFPVTIILVLLMLTFIPLLAIARFHSTNFLSTSSLLFAVKTRSSPYNNSQMSPPPHSYVASSITRIKSNELREEPWCTPTSIRKSSDNTPATPTLDLIYAYTIITSFTSRSGKKRAHLMALLKAFSRSTKTW